jgi:hypothetical protein
MHTFRYLFMRLALLFFLFQVKLIAQHLSYSPDMTLEKTVSLNYYDTDYIFIENSSEYSTSVSFELISANLPKEWSATGCTNSVCYIKIPDSGILGSVGPGSQAYISINLSVNEFAGDGEIRYAIFDEQNPGNPDTIAFVYHANEVQNTPPQPWAKINFAQNTITIFLENETSQTILTVFDIQGNSVVQIALEEITSYSLSHLANGIYIVLVKSETGHELIQKIVKVDY